MADLRRRAWGRGEIRRQPEGKIRQSQVVSTFGPGAMVDLVDHAVLIGGLNFWKYSTFKVGKGIKVIHEPRLRDALVDRLRPRGINLHLRDAFREPPAGDDEDPSDACGVQAVEFPQWFVCQSPQCRALSRSDALEKKDNRYHHECGRNKRTECVPVRFVLACRRGHVDEFPWRWFAHRDEPDGGNCANPLLELREGATGDFSEVQVVCKCGARGRLSTALVLEQQPQCQGSRPWLGREGKEACEEKARLLVRTASNSYFAQVVSALSIPDPARELEDAIRSAWDVLENASAATLPAFRTIDKVKAAIGGVSDADALAAIEAIKAGQAPREQLRSAEFRQFMGSKPDKAGDIPHQDDLFFARIAKANPAAPPQVGRLVLVHKLREVRVQIGFTRLEATTADLQGEYDMEVESAALGLTSDWLPAIEVRGEGVLVCFSEEAVRAWEAKPAVQERQRHLEQGYEAWSKNVENAPPFPGARFYMLHSLSHLLITALSLECGYSASSIRERIYCAPANDDLPMAAILLSTGTSGQEGTLGGLVEQGRRITEHLRRAWDLGVLCSNDSVCAGHSPARDPTDRHLEGAACHGCLFVAECSCERFNRYLDRALVVPSIGHAKDLAFFPSRP